MPFVCFRFKRFFFSDPIEEEDEKGVSPLILGLRNSSSNRSSPFSLVLIVCEADPV